MPGVVAVYCMILSMMFSHQGNVDAMLGYGLAALGWGWIALMQHEEEDNE